MNPGLFHSALAVFLRPFIRYLDKPALPRYSGHLKLAGLHGEVKVLWQHYAIPHVFAASEHDLFFAQGFLHAQERLWQMESSRRFLSGRLAEIFGDYALPWRELGQRWRGSDLGQFDYYLRLIGVRRAAVAAEAAVGSQHYEHLKAYANGVNRYIEQRGKKLPWEFRLLRYQPEPWQPVDSLTVGKGLALLLSTALDTRLNRIALAAKLRDQPQKLATLYPRFPANGKPITRALWDSTEQVWRFVNGAFAVSPWHAAGHGSNNWALSPHRTTTGNALLCNDPHLRFTLPDLFYLMHLRAEPTPEQTEGYELWGASIPGLPYVQLGHNRDIAWGVTAALCDDVELYREQRHRIDPDLYRHGDTWRTLSRQQEIIAVRGRPSLNQTIRFTAHGPVISDFANGGADELITMRWTAHEASQELRAAYAVNRARNWQEFLDALAYHGAPSLNYVYADRENNIGYCLAGKIPQRSFTPSLLPLDGSNPANEWHGFVPFAELPRLYNPPEGAVATANNQIVDTGHPVFISQHSEPPYRIQRIAELLNAHQRHSLADMAAIQMDTVSRHARDLIHTLADDLRSLASHLELGAPAAQLVAWDGDCGAESAEAALFHLFHHRLLVQLLVPTLGNELFRAYVEILNQCIAPLDEIFGNPHSIWFAERSRCEIVANALGEACAELRTRGGSRYSALTWGTMHRLEIKHALGRSPWIGRSVNLGPMRSAGDGMTVNAGHYRHSNPFDHFIGAALRMIVDTGDWSRSGFVLPGGQSGHPGSPHYCDQLALWHQGRTVKLHVEVALEADHCLIISPC